MSKKLYNDEDINDLVADDLEKGGKGSGIKGHKTLKDRNFHDRMQSGALDKNRGAMLHFRAEKQKAMSSGDKEAAAHYRKLEEEATSNVMRAMNKSQSEMDINDLVETDMNHEEEFFKGRGPDKQPRKKRGEGHNGEYGFQTHGNYSPDADKKNQAESKKKFDEAVEADKQRAKIKENYKKMGRGPNGEGPT